MLFVPLLNFVNFPESLSLSLSLLSSFLQCLLLGHMVISDLLGSASRVTLQQYSTRIYRNSPTRTSQA